MRIADKIYIDLDTEHVPGEIFGMLTYDNPDYYQKMNLGLSVWNVPETIKTYNLRGTTLEVMRGEALRVKPLIQNYEYIFDHADHPIALQYINLDFDLDEYQEGAVNAIKEKRQGVVHAVTSAGKSLIILKAIVELRQKALIVVHRKVLMDQLLKDIKKYIRDENGNQITPGIIGNGSCSIGDITIAIDKSASKHIGDIRSAFGTVMLDECHLAPASTIFSLINGINSKYRFGFSGTLKRKDQKEFLIFSTFGQVIHTIGKEELLDKGRVVPVEVRILESETQFDWDSAVQELGQTKARALQEKTISLDPRRNDMILQHVAGLKGKTLVLSRYVAPCYTLQELLRERYGIESGVITGKDSKEALESYNAMKEGDMQVIFATIGCVSTGVSISDLEHGVLISPIYTNELLLHQIRGRLMRTATGKEKATLWFVYDQFIYPAWKLTKFLRIMRE